MIDACAVLRGFSPVAPAGVASAAFLHCAAEWPRSAGEGVVVGLLDTGFNQNLADLAGADLTARDFTGCATSTPSADEHGTYSVALLIGQGRHQIRGLAPAARTFVASVVGEDGLARPSAVADGLDWLVSCGARIIAAPLGGATEHEEIARRIALAGARTALFAAAGNAHPDPIAFPARHPLAVAVGAADQSGNILPDCSRSPRLDLIAPGFDVAAPVGDGAAVRRSGSSVACVIAAGVAALAASAAAVPAHVLCRTRLLNALRTPIPQGTTARGDSDRLSAGDVS